MMSDDEQLAPPIETPTVFTVPAGERFFEDYPAGAVYDFAQTVAVDEQDLIAFAHQFDPQGIHTNPELAAAGPYGGLIASGWHTAAIMMRLFVDQYGSSVASLGGPAADELRWLRPVRPGDLLRLRT